MAVIGAGIIGVSTAFELAGRGYAVTVFDPYPPGRGGPSRRNAGHIGASDIQPLSAPGVALTGLKLMLQKDSPLRIPGSEKIKLIPWFAKFLATSRGNRYRNACAAITYLCRSAIDETDQLFADTGISEKLTRIGAGFIYDSAGSFTASQNNWRRKAAAGFKSEPMARVDIATSLPDLAPRFAHGMVALNWAKVSDPLEIVEGIVDAAKAKGVNFQTFKVSRIAVSDTGLRLFTTNGELDFDGVVVAAGVQSKSFAARLGERLPLVAERGYNLTFPDPGFKLKIPLVFPDRGIAATHLTEGLRIGGWAEYSSSPDRAEAKSYYRDLARISAELFPGLCQDGALAWMGNRPSLPDSVPVISRSHKCYRIFYNCGHGHYGLTHAAASARIVGGLVAGGLVPEAHKAFAIDRFH